MHLYKFFRSLVGKVWTLRCLWIKMPNKISHCDKRLIIVALIEQSLVNCMALKCEPILLKNSPKIYKTRTRVVLFARTLSRRAWGKLGQVVRVLLFSLNRQSESPTFCESCTPDKQYFSKNVTFC